MVQSRLCSEAGRWLFVHESLSRGSLGSTGPSRPLKQGPAFGADGVTIQQFNEPAGGQAVFRTHIRVIPGFDGVPLRPHTGGIADRETLAARAEKLKGVLG